MQISKRKVGLVASLTATFASLASSAFAVAPYSLDGATSGVADQVTAVLTDVLPVAGGIIALFIGWKILKRMVKA